MTDIGLRQLAEADLVERSEHVDVVRLLACAHGLETIRGNLKQDP